MTNRKRSRRIDTPAVAGGLVVIVVVLAALFVPVLSPYGAYEQNPEDAFLSSSWSHPLGTDQFGRDVLTRLLYGARTALVIGFGAVALATLVGGLLGLLAGYYGRRLDSLIMRSMDLLLAFPLIILAILLVVVLGPSMINLIIAVGVSQVPTFARVTRSLVVALRKREFVEAVVSLGASDRRIIRSDIIPNILPTVLALATTTIGLAVLYAAALSFLGVGMQPPSPDWGRMVADNSSLIFTFPALSLYPGLAIALTALALNLIGDGLLRIVDPSSSRTSWV
jgi:peptide/nickel transport system permease protein